MANRVTEIQKEAAAAAEYEAELREQERAQLLQQSLKKPFFKNYFK